MIVDTVHLASAVDGRLQQLARMHICNDGRATIANPRLGDYIGETFVGRDADALAQGRVAKRGEVRGWRRHDFHVWNLVRRMLDAMGYDKGARSAERGRTAFADLPLVDPDGDTPDVEIGSAVDCVRVDRLTRELMAAEIEAGMAGGLDVDQAFTGVSGGILGALLALTWRNRIPGATVDQLADHLRDGVHGVLTEIAAEDEPTVGRGEGGGDQ